jgi:P4 family phage/plasmid primase-like protien
MTKLNPTLAAFEPWPLEVHTYKRDNTPSQNALAFLLARPSKLIFANGEFYTLDLNGVYRALEDDELRAEIRQTDPGIQYIGTAGQISMMLDELRITERVRTAARPYAWIDAPLNAPPARDLVLAANGLVNAMTGERLPLDGGYFATATPEWSYDAKAECPLWLEKLNVWLDPSYHDTLQEFMGYLLVPDVRLHAMLALIGASRGGKGTVSRIIKALIGKAHCASPDFEDFAGPFGLENLTDKRIALMPDTEDTSGNKRGLAVARLKTIAGGDEVNVNRKNKKALADVQLMLKIVLVANIYPHLLDESLALAKRQVLVRFERTTPKAEIDIELTEKLKAELAGIANWAMAGLRRLRERGEFTVGAAGKVALAKLEEQQSISLRYANNRLTLAGCTAGDLVPVQVAYDDFVNWADRNGVNRKLIRDKATFETDMIAALQNEGLGTLYEKGQKRWRPPGDTGHGAASKYRDFFTGAMLRPVSED